MTYKTYYLAFNTPLHLGNHKPESYEQSEDFLRSDTIVAAVYATWAKMGHEDWIPEDGNPPFTVSSAFPYMKKADGNYVHFFPRPRVRFNRKDEDNKDSTIRKKIKKVQWLDQTYFEAVIHYRDLSEIGMEDDQLKDNCLTIEDVDVETHITRDLLQRVKISRNVDNPEVSDPFYMERIFFNKAGLYFLAVGDSLDRLELALDFLQHEGFGTDRSVGNGFFELKKGSIDIDAPKHSVLMTNLSLFTPESKKVFIQSIDHPDAAFESIKRGGWITTPGYQSLAKKSIMMFAEGGLWKIDEQISGRGNINLTPSTIPIDHPVWRSGKSIFIPIKTN